MRVTRNLLGGVFFLFNATSGMVGGVVDVQGVSVFPFSDPRLKPILFLSYPHGQVSFVPGVYLTKSQKL